MDPLKFEGADTPEAIPRREETTARTNATALDMARRYTDLL
jgi:hypothetical protein